MPFAIWCSTCPKETIIGQGVRFNAEKKKMGSYHSTPIYSFRMKHPACGGWIEIRTDPQNTAYVVTEGATKRDTGEDVVRDGDVQLRSEAEKERLRNDAFAALEVTIEDRQQATIDKSRIEELYHAKDRDWDDPYAASRKIRKSFRVERKRREKDLAATDALKERMSLGIHLLPESDADRRRTALVDFEGKADGGAVVLKTARGGDHARTLQAALARNTREAVDPFSTSASSLDSGIAGLKRKRTVAVEGQGLSACQRDAPLDGDVSRALVDYDSE